MRRLLPQSVRQVPRPGVLAPGHYLTDGARLFRVVSGLVPGGGTVSAALEDCYTLEIESYSPDELYHMGLRLVLLE